MYRAVLYRTRRGDSPVEKFLDELPEKHQQKIAGFVDLLEEHGPALRRPYADHVRGPIRELRIQFGRGEYRILHFFMLRDLVVLLHAFRKKTEAIPEREIGLAEERMVDFRLRVEAGEVTP